MRWIPLCICSLALCADTGITPRASSSDYPVHESAKTVTIAAAIVPPDQVKKMFSAAISDQYVVIEVAVYPQDGHTFNIDSHDFALRVAGRLTQAEKPRDVAPWPEKRGPAANSPVDVTTETGVVYSRSSDPINGRRQGVGTYSGVGVSNYPRPQDPQQNPSGSGRDPHVEEKVLDKALPEGETTKAVAGYLYFPQYTKKKKTDAVELEYSKDDVSLNLLFR